MAVRSISRVLVVVKRTSYDLYVRRHRMARVRALLRANDPSVARLERADAHHRATVAEVRAAITDLGLKARFRERSALGDASGFDLVITVGGDGTLLSASHVLGETPVFGINSAPLDSVGFLCSTQQGQVRDALADAIAGRTVTTYLSRLRVSVDDVVVHTRVLNDVLYAHRNPAMTARYFLTFRGETEEHKSSGIWVAPPAGSTAAVRSAGGRVLPVRSRKLQFVVREPYRPDGRGFDWNTGFVEPGESLDVLNKMREAMLYIDGPRTTVPIEIGQHIRFDLSPERLAVLGYARRPSFNGETGTNSSPPKRAR